MLDALGEGLRRRSVRQDHRQVAELQLERLSDAPLSTDGSEDSREKEAVSESTATNGKRACWL